MILNSSIIYPVNIDTPFSQQLEIRASPPMQISPRSSISVLLLNIIEASSNSSAENIEDLKRYGKEIKAYTTKYFSIRDILENLEAACNEESINLKTITDLANNAFAIIRK